jgi:hypothetical protein
MKGSFAISKETQKVALTLGKALLPLFELLADDGFAIRVRQVQHTPASNISGELFEFCIADAGILSEVESHTKGEAGRLATCEMRSV